MKVHRKTTADYVATIRELTARVERQTRVLQGACKDATLSHTAAAAAFQMAAAAEFLLQGGMVGAARHVLTAMQMVENEYQRHANPAAPAPRKDSGGSDG